MGEYQAGGYIIVLGLGHDKGGVVENDFVRQACTEENILKM